MKGNWEEEGSGGESFPPSGRADGQMRDKRAPLLWASVEVSLPGMPLLNLCLILLQQKKQMGCGEQTLSPSEWRERWGWASRPWVRQELPIPRLPSQGRPAAGALRRALGPQLPFSAWGKTSPWSLSPCPRASFMFSYNNFLYSMKKGGSYFCCR